MDAVAPDVLPFQGLYLGKAGARVEQQAERGYRRGGESLLPVEGPAQPRQLVRREETLALPFLVLADVVAGIGAVGASMSWSVIAVSSLPESISDRETPSLDIPPPDRFRLHSHSRRSWARL